MRVGAEPAGPVRRRGVTLVEMLVVVTLVILMMTILASIFQAATGAIIASRTNTELDNELRSLDITIRQDLAGITAKMTPPNIPADKPGYFEYSEGVPADLQGEDTDDYLAFTTKAPPGQAFTGRIWVPYNINNYTGSVSQTAVNISTQPVLISSQVAEVIYFLRGQKLYRRVLLVVPERNGSPVLSTSNPTSTIGFQPGMFGLGSSIYTSWMSVNDISARPNDTSTIAAVRNYPIFNDLGDLTNRENRYARPRFGDDFYDATSGNYGRRDGNADDGNADAVHDYWPTLTASQVNLAGSAASGTAFSGSAKLLMNEDSASKPGGSAAGGYARITPPGSVTDLYAFPFIYPGMYSTPETHSVNNGYGLLHGLDPNTVGGIGTYSIFDSATGSQVTFPTPANHAALEDGDSLPRPSAFTTWWGFPTWRETASLYWSDPVYSISSGGNLPTNSFAVGIQPLGLQTVPSTTAVASPNRNANLLPPIGSLPPDSLTAPVVGGYSGSGHYVAPFGSDDSGYLGSSAFMTPAPGATADSFYYAAVWEDDLIMTGVRSFDVKALDSQATVYNGLGPAANPLFYNAGYYDLGYASSDLVAVGNTAGSSSLLNPGHYNAASTFQPGNTAYASSYILDANFNPRGFGHEGRIPPLTADFRVDPQRPFIRDFSTNVLGLPNNVGDDTPGVIRLRRVWDSWSTDYTQAPQVDINSRGSPLQSTPYDRPIYPSYPAPYPQPLRGLQIQIRVVDAKNQKAKVLTIHQDFSGNL